MPRLLTNVKFWGLAMAVVWLVVITAIIMKDPALARGK